MKKVYEDSIQVVYEDKYGLRITTLKKKPTHDFWGNPYNQPERSKREDQRCNFCLNPESILTPETCCTGCGALNSMET